jgi:hypothetical protein
VGIFRRDESLNERLAREGGLLENREDLRPSWDKVGVHGVQRPREWDAVATVELPGLAGDAVTFVTLADGSLIVEEETGDTDLSTAAEAVEANVAPPYRAHAVRRDGDVWAVAARRITTAKLAAEGDEIELTEHGGERAFTVDGVRLFGSVPELEEIGRREGDAYVVRARRIDGDVWEVSADPL